MHGCCDQRLLVSKTQIREHAPFQIKERMAFAKADSINGNSGCASRNDIKTADMSQVFETDRSTEMFHTVKPGRGFLQPRGTDPGSSRRKPRCMP